MELQRARREMLVSGATPDIVVGDKTAISATAHIITKGGLCERLAPRAFSPSARLLSSNPFLYVASYSL
jgi:hypothetical protein